MRWEQLLDDRRDSERPMSLVMNGDSLGELGPGDLQMLLLRLGGEGGVGENKGVVCVCVWAGGVGSAVASSRRNAPQRPPLQRAVLHRVGSLQERVGRGGEAHAGGGRGAEVGPRRAQPEPVQALPDRVVLYQQLQGVAGAVDQIIHLNKSHKTQLPSQSTFPGFLVLTTISRTTC